MARPWQIALAAARLFGVAWSADKFAADTLEQFGAGAFHPFEGNHLPRDDHRAGLAHALKGQRLVAGPPRADDFFDDEDFVATGAQVQHRLQHAHVSLADADEELPAFATRALEQLAVAGGGKMPILEIGGIVDGLTKRGN